MASPRTPSSGEPDKPSQQAHSSYKFSFAKHLLPALGYDSAVPVLPSVCSDPSVCSNSVTAGSSHKCDAAEGQRCYDISRLVVSVCTASCSLSAAPASLANAKEPCWSGVDRCQVCLQPINDLRGSNHLGTLLTLCPAATGNKRSELAVHRQHKCAWSCYITLDKHCQETGHDHEQYSR